MMMMTTSMTTMTMMTTTTMTTMMTTTAIMTDYSSSVLHHSVTSAKCCNQTAGSLGTWRYVVFASRHILQPILHDGSMHFDVVGQQSHLTRHPDHLTISQSASDYHMRVGQGLGQGQGQTIGADSGERMDLILEHAVAVGRGGQDYLVSHLA
jgi:hypothetical protein